MDSAPRSTVSRGRRIWLLVMGLLIGPLGLLNVTGDPSRLELGVGIAQLLFAALAFTAAGSPRVAAVIDRPIRRRDRPEQLETPDQR